MGGVRTRPALGALALIAAATTAWLAFASPPSAGGTDSTRIETLQVDATSDDVITSTTSLDSSRAYKITVTGVTSVWGDKSGVIDGLYCFTSSRCEDRGAPPVRFPKLLINETTLDDFAGIEGRLPFEQSHRYAMHVSGVAGPLRLQYNDTNFSDNSGSYEVTIQLGEPCLAGLPQDEEFSIIEGSEAADPDLDGTPESDIILGKGGDDIIDGKGGSDLICAGDGDDIVEGGAGADIIRGDDGEDQLIGGRQRDVMSDGFDGEGTLFDGGKGNDTMIAAAGSGRNIFRGGPGADTMLGGDRKDEMYGEEGRDTMEGNGGKDKLVGGRGRDTLDGGGARDRFFGGRNGDSLLAQDGRKDRKLRGGSGNDCATFDRVERRRLRSIERRPCPESSRSLRNP